MIQIIGELIYLFFPFPIFDHNTSLMVIPKNYIVTNVFTFCIQSEPFTKLNVSEFYQERRCFNKSFHRFLPDSELLHYALQSTHLGITTQIKYAAYTFKFLCLSNLLFLILLLCTSFFRCHTFGFLCVDSFWMSVIYQKSHYLVCCYFLFKGTLCSLFG